MIHIVPNNDIEEHLCETGKRTIFSIYGDSITYYCNCKCSPIIKIENYTPIIIHNSFDGREGIEWANEILYDKE